MYMPDRTIRTRGVQACMVSADCRYGRIARELSHSQGYRRTADTKQEGDQIDYMHKKYSIIETKELGSH